MKLVFAQFLVCLFCELIVYGQVPNWKDIKPPFCVNDESYQRPNESMNVNVCLIIISLYDISEDKMEFGMQVILTDSWKDPYMNTSGLVNRRFFESLPSHIEDCLWKPDTIFWNAKTSKLYQDTLPNANTKLLLDGFIYRSGRYRLTLSCTMNFHFYPMDSQYCSLIIGFFASTTVEINASWLKYKEDFKGVYFLGDIKPLNFDIRFIDTNVTLLKKYHMSIQSLYANFVFVRSLVASIVNIYVPSFLVVCLSMVSFWLDVNAVPGRVTLGVTAILTLATQIVQARASLPTLDYMTAMDVWLLGCMIMVFLSLIEFTLAQSWSRNYQGPKERSGIRSHPWEKSPSLYLRKFCRSGKSKVKPRKCSKKVVPNDQKGFPKVNADNILDRTSRVCFPCSFVAFTVTYWVFFYYKAYSN